ncbi:unnamed protein product [Leptidea sinapis]|uniref:Basic leucine zipper domain-containing protein n=1 Tax=Leptidea sinapis TaxID=189913 RepID=A0A5E4QA49_9NEOP|nr:unnamed protein product [Leptidea sinapis]
MPHDLKGLAARKAIMAPLSPTPCAEISDDELVSISVRDLNRQLKMRGLTRDQIVRNGMTWKLCKTRITGFGRRSKPSDQNMMHSSDLLI